MDGEQQREDVKLLWNSVSPYAARIAMALRIKSIPFNYVEEDLSNKSELLLKYNPLHKKIPVLVHNNKPLAESLVILEYIDEFWNENPKLLPDDPYNKAKARFWANYHDQKVIPACHAMMMASDEAQAKAFQELQELLAMLGQGIEIDFPEKFALSSNYETLDYLDIVVGSTGCLVESFQEAFDVIVDSGKQARFFSWMKALKQHPVMMEMLPPHETTIAKLQQKFLGLKKA